MRKLLHFTLLLIATLAFTNAFALKEVKVQSIIEPEDKIITSQEIMTYKIAIENSGDENILSTDSIFVAFGLYPQGTILAVYGTTHELAPGDTFHFSFNFKFNSAQTGNFQLLFLSSLTKQVADFKGIYGTFNIIGAIGNNNIELNKVYYANGNLNLQVKSNTAGLSELNITSINGQLLKRETLNLIGESNYQIAVGYFPAGIYILSITKDGRITTKKFMVR